MAKKRSRSRVPVGEDRISDLPESVISHILSFLPTKNVVATSVLSTRWKLLWTKVTTLDFIQDKGHEWAGVEFVRFVRKVLRSIDSQRLQKFRLEWWPTPNMRLERVPKWINYAITRSVRELVIDFAERRKYSSNSTLDLHLPGTLFTCATFQVLKLSGYFEFKVPSVVCLPNLEVLDLYGVLYESNECLPRLLCGCPVLLSLTIGRNDSHTMNDIRVISPSLRRLQVSNVFIESVFYGKLELDAPNLEYFKLDENLEEYSVKRLKSVKYVELDLDVERFQESVDDMDFDELCIGRYNSTVKLVEALNHVRFMTLKPTIIKAFSHATTPLSVCFERLIKLDVTADCCHLTSLGDILGRSINLQILNISTMYRSCIIDHKLCWNDLTNVPECLSSSLQKVSFFNFKGFEDQMAMIRYILQHGEVLESLILEPTVYARDINKRYQLLEHVSTFPRCSRVCQIHFD